MAQVSTDSFPDVVRIEPVGLCNFQCIHCPTGTTPNKRPPMKRDKFRAIIDQFVAKGAIPRVVVLYHGGEPLINRDLAYFIRFLKTVGVKKTVINTNGGLLTQERSKELIEAGLDELRASFDGETEEENDHIRTNGNFYKNASNVKALIRLRRDLGLKNPAIVIDNIRICDKKTLEALFASNNQEWVFSEPPRFLKEFFHQERTEISMRSFPARVWPGYKRFGDFEIVSFSSPKVSYCSLAFETVTILANGDVVPCCYDLNAEIVFGNIYKTNIFEIWKSPAYATFRANFRKQKYEDLCKRCVVINPRFLCKKSSLAR